MESKDIIESLDKSVRFPVMERPPGSGSAIAAFPDAPLRPMPTVKITRHIFSIDLECWYELVNREFGRDQGIDHRSLERQLDCILQLLSETKTYATFFVLGSVARQMPKLVPLLASLGHELAIHGSAHRTFHQHTPKSLREDILDCKKLVEDQAGFAVTSHRAPAFSITQDTLWALDVLVECGLRIDSSIFPIRLPRYGISNFSLCPHMVRGPGGGEIFEIPLTVVPWLGLRWPVSGGGYARLLPKRFLCGATCLAESNRRPMVLYFHPYEFDPSPLIPPAEAPFLKRFLLSRRWNLRRTSIPSKVKLLLERFTFGRVDQYVQGQSN